MSRSRGSRIWPRSSLSKEAVSSEPMKPLTDTEPEGVTLLPEVRLEDDAIQTRVGPEKGTQQNGRQLLTSSITGRRQHAETNRWRRKNKSAKRANHASPASQPHGPEATQRGNRDREQSNQQNIGPARHTQGDSGRESALRARDGNNFLEENSGVSHQRPPRKRRVGDHGEVFFRGEHEEGEDGRPEVVEVVSLRRVAAHLHSHRQYRRRHQTASARL